MKIRLTALLLLFPVILAGCNQSTVTKITSARFSVELPNHWSAFTPNKDNGEIAYYSDGKTADAFNEGEMSVLTYADVFKSGTTFDQNYCDNSYHTIDNPAVLVNFKGINKLDVKFVAAANGKSAYCDISYELLNKNTTEFVEKQSHREYLFIDGTDELIVEVGTTADTLPGYLLQVLNSFTPIPKK